MSDSAGNTKSTSDQDFQLGVPYKKGDFIGEQYEVYGVLGEGGFGIVYLVYSHQTGEVLALKTFRNEFLADQGVRKRFQAEANVWVELGHHPYLVLAHFINEISGRLYIAMEYVAPNEEGLNSLDGYLRKKAPDLAQSLHWAIQICYGMEYAYSKGLRAHRDLKPTNIMITRDKTPKITDFGIASVTSEVPTIQTVSVNMRSGESDLSRQTTVGTGFGTPTHMAPEQFVNAAGCDERSDIYSFGIVLYQMVAGGQVPFLASRSDGPEQMMAEFLHLHGEASVPQLDSPLFPIIRRCLQKSPEKRFQTFQELQGNLELLLQRQTGEVMVPPRLEEFEIAEWNNKGTSLTSLGRHEEAVSCYDKALELDPRQVTVWNNKGSSVDSMGHHEEAISCCEQALELDPSLVAAWINKGNGLHGLGRNEEAIPCYDKALELDPCNAGAWHNKGSMLQSMGQPEQAIRCFDKALELDPRDAAAWNNKGNSLNSLGRNEEAIACYDKALELDPCNAGVWHNRGSSLYSLGRNEEAIPCYDKALELDPQYVNAWYKRGRSLASLGRHEQAIACFDRALKLDPSDGEVWYDKGNSLYGLGRYEEAIHSYDKVLEVDPCNADAWYNKGTNLRGLEHHEEAIVCFAKALELDSCYVAAWVNEGASLAALSHNEEAIHCYDRALELDPCVAEAWINKGNSLHSLGRYEEAIRCYDEVLELDPRDADAWFYRGLAEDGLGHKQEAAYSYQQFLALAPAQQYAVQVDYARKRLQELENSTGSE
jgi:tetratricopeptide (TPR) repeat protein